MGPRAVRLADLRRRIERASELFQQSGILIAEARASASATAAEPEENQRALRETLQRPTGRCPDAPSRRPPTRRRSSPQMRAHAVTFCEILPALGSPSTRPSAAASCYAHQQGSTSAVRFRRSLSG